MQTKGSGLAGVALVLVGVVALSGLMLAVAMLGQHGCGDDVALPAGPANAAARQEIPPKLLPLFEQVGSQERVYWQVLAGVSKEECTFGEDSDPSCTIRWHGTGLGPANSAGAAGLMQIGIGGAAGNEWDAYGTDGDHNGHKDPHDPFDAVPAAAKVLRQGKGMPAAPAPLAKIREAVRGYNGSGPMAEAYADRVMADAARYGLNDGAQPQAAGDAAAAVPGGDCAIRAPDWDRRTSSRPSRSTGRANTTRCRPGRWPQAARPSSATSASSPTCSGFCAPTTSASPPAENPATTPTAPAWPPTSYPSPGTTGPRPPSTWPKTWAGPRDAAPTAWPATPAASANSSRRSAESSTTATPGTAIPPTRAQAPTFTSRGRALPTRHPAWSRRRRP